jgi:hypothetical protein
MLLRAKMTIFNQMEMHHLKRENTLLTDLNLVADK